MEIEKVSPQWRPLSADGQNNALAYFYGKISSPQIEFKAVRIDLAAPGLHIVVKGGAPGSAKTLSTKVSSFVSDNALAVGINAVPFYYISSEEEGDPITNTGIVVSDGVVIAPPHRLYDALVWYADGRVSIVSQPEIHSVEEIKNAVGGFYQILKANELTGRVLERESRHPRSAAGISADSRYLYLLAIDGRRFGSAGSTEAETALLLRALGCWDGINLDGGGSSSLALRYPDGTVRVVNTPVHEGVPGRERAVAGCLGVGIGKSGEK